MQINVCLVQALQFFRQFRLVVCHKPKKKHIILDTLSYLTSANTNLFLEDSNYLELDILFSYNTTLIKIYLNLVKQIVKRYKADDC